jgi:hypothetical protein
MPLNPKRVQAVFLEATDYHDPVARAAILDRECSADLELRRRVEALLRAHDELTRATGPGNSTREVRLAKPTAPAPG